MRHLVTAIGAAAATALTVAVPATASPEGTKTVTTKRALVTEIREVQNDTGNPISLFKGEDSSRFSTTPISPYSKKTGTMWVPWVGENREMYKSIAVYQKDNRALYWIFQDYGDPSDQVRFSKSNSYAASSVVPGGTGGGRKRLIINGNGPSMQPTS